MVHSIFCMIVLSLLLIVASAIDYEYSPKPNRYNYKQETEELEDKLPTINYDEANYPKEEDDQYNHHIPSNKPEYNYNLHHDNINFIGVQGRILCKSAHNIYSPLVGAVVRIACVAEDENKYERSPFSIVSQKSDEKGFFLATLSVSEVLGSENLKLKKCNAFLQDSPMEDCKVPTDVNNGMSGAFLNSDSFSRFLPQRSMALYTVGPFIYTSKPNSVPDNDHY